MRTIDPEAWYKKVKDTQTKRKIFGSKSATGFETRLRSSFIDAVKDFWENCSIKCIKYMREKNMPRPVRRCYIMFVLLLTVSGLVVLESNWRAFRSQPPLLINLLPMQHPVQYVDFPAVAVCSYSVISKTALKGYASYLHSLDRNGTYTLEAIERNLLTFGALLTWSLPPVDVAFMQYLARVAHETNVTNIIIKLTPKCSSFLKRCGWRTVRVPCDRLFALRATPHGLCCAFNSRYQDEDLYNPVQKLNFVGDDYGLSLVVKKNDSDVAYIRGPGEGVEILLFDGSEYPLIEGGSPKIYLTQRNASAFFKLSVRAQYIAPGLKYFSEQWRGCRIRKPRSRNIDHRSQEWCLANCRRSAVQALCGCVPHLLFPQTGDTICSPDQLACLNKHKEKLMYFYPGDYADPSLNEESSDSLNCEHCLPDCGRITYSAAVSHADYQFTQKLFLNNFLQGASLVNTTVIRIFYASEDQHLFIVESNMRWVELIEGTYDTTMIVIIDFT
ncbi:sodium channel protein Nach-like [Epargyreus clarus]|uniref:sodium channel protein Nach-like n=1 Tax=Epargyreus clarus TaxID=520877 RepID=UPI003C2EAB4B